MFQYDELDNSRQGTQVMLNPTGRLYIDEKLGPARNRELTRRAEIHQALASTSWAGQVRIGVAGVLRKLADRVEPARSPRRTASAGR